MKSVLSIIAISAIIISACEGFTTLTRLGISSSKHCQTSNTEQREEPNHTRELSTKSDCYRTHCCMSALLKKETYDHVCLSSNKLPRTSYSFSYQFEYTDPLLRPPIFSFTT